jgi:hypothetical protein
LRRGPIRGVAAPNLSHRFSEIAVYLRILHLEILWHDDALGIYQFMVQVFYSDNLRATNVANDGLFSHTPARLS